MRVLVTDPLAADGLEILREQHTVAVRTGLSEADLGRVMDRLLSRQVDAADVYFQYARLESWVLDDGIIKEGSHSIEQGAGLRAVSGDKTGFAYTDSLELGRLLDAVVHPGAYRIDQRCEVKGRGRRQRAIDVSQGLAVNPQRRLPQ